MSSSDNITNTLRPILELPRPDDNTLNAPNSFLKLLQTPVTQLASKPSWIGPVPPPRPLAPGIPVMKTTVRLSYSNAGLQAPVFVAISLSEPQWQPIEMEYTKKDDGELEFYKDFEAEEGQYQYKLRLGPGDWWVLDENKQTSEYTDSVTTRAQTNAHIVDDGSGNRNNLLNVEVAEKQADAPTKPAVGLPKPTEQAAVIEQPYTKTEAAPAHTDIQTHSLDQATAPVQNPEQSTKSIQPVEAESSQKSTKPEQSDATHEEAPLFRHESFITSPEDEVQDPPLFRHESLSAGPEDDEDRDDEPAHYYDQEDAGPLLKHETIGMDIPDEHEVPLFRHETMTDHVQDASSVQQPLGLAIEETEMSNLEHEDFPTDPVAIMQRLRRLSTHMPRDETVVEGTPPSPSMAASRRSSVGDGSAPRSISEMSEHSPSPLDAINEAPEEDSSAQPEEVHKTRRKYRDHRHGQKHDQQRNVPVELLTPPMTPLVAETEGDEGRFQSLPSELSQSMSEQVKKLSDDSTDNVVSSESVTATDGVKSQQPDQGLVTLIKGFIYGFGAWFAGLCGGPSRATYVSD